MNRKEMYRTVIYLDFPYIRSFTLEQEYIDFNMRERYNSLSDFISDEIHQRLEMNFHADYYHSVDLKVCQSPNIYSRLCERSLLKFLIDNDFNLKLINQIDEYEQNQFNNNLKYQVYKLETSTHLHFANWARRVLARGLKTKMNKYKKLDSWDVRYHQFDIVHNQLTKKIKKYEAN